ncbi:MAG TPA: sigma-70 family RNA polymerase sigma factor [Solirubrobacteraceae bacterium]
MAIARLSPRLLRAASDERLVALTRAGLDAAFEAIYDRHHRQILSFCRHMLGSHAEGEDAVQQTFLSAHRALLESERPVHLRAWLHTIARNRCVSTLRARREQPADEPLEVATAGLADVVQRREDLRDLLADLAALPEPQRAALVLSELGALSHEEIAGVLGVPRVKVKALVFQARESLLAARSARDTDCREIREQLATLTGSSLRRAPLRRHLAVCDGCRAYKAEISRQRSALAILLPVVPTAALKHGVLGGAGATAGGGLLAAGGKGVALKVAVTAAVAATAAGGTIVAVEEHTPARADAPVAGVATHRAAHVTHGAGARPRSAARPAATARTRPRPQRAPSEPRPHRTAVHPRPRHTSMPAPAPSPHTTSPGGSARTPSRTGATPSHANPTPGVPRGKALGHAKPHPATPAKVKPVKVHPAKPARPSRPPAAAKPRGQSAAPTASRTQTTSPCRTVFSVTTRGSTKCSR